MKKSKLRYAHVAHGKAFACIQVHVYTFSIKIICACEALHKFLDFVQRLLR